MFDTLRVGREISDDIPLIVINEPIFIVSGRNSDLRYNDLYPRWAYDAYRQALAQRMTAQDFLFYDYWNVLPSAEFANNVFHRDPQGEKHFADILSPILWEFSCP